MSQAADLRFHYSGKDLGSDGATPTTQTADSGTVSTVVDAALTEANDYWNGAVIEWLTGANAGLFSTVEDFDAATDTLTLEEDLAAAVAAGHTYRLYLQLGNYRSSVEIVGLKSTAPVNVTGTVMKSVGMFQGPGSGTLEFIFNGGGAARALRWTAPGDTAGSQVVVGGSNGDYVLESNDISKWVEVTVTIASLPGSDQSDALTLTAPRHRFIGPILGSENSAGLTRYALMVARNRHATDSLFNLSAYLRKNVWMDSAGAQQTVTPSTVGGGGYAASGAVNVTLADASTYPATGHVKNATSGEIMQYNSRDGNVLKVAASGRGLRGTSAAAGNNGETIDLWPPFDIGLEASGGGGQYQTIASDTTAPAAVTFTSPVTGATGLSIGDKAATAHHGIWIREVVAAGGRPVLNLINYVNVDFEVA